MPAKRCGNPRGASLAAPIRVRRTDGLPSQRGTGALANVQEFEDKIVGGYGFRTRHHFFEDFNNAIPTYVLYAPLILTASNADINKTPVANTNVSIAYIAIPRAGRLISADITGEDALAANDTNYLTFAITNLQDDAAGSAVLSLADDTNTTKATGGTGITAKVPRSIFLSATTADLYVQAGDVLEVKATATQTPGAVDAPLARLVFQEIPRTVTSLVTRTNGNPSVDFIADQSGGWLRCTLGATSEAMFQGVSFGDQRTFMANKHWELAAYVNFAASLAANEEFIFGVASDYTATLDNITINAWFRITGAGLTLKIQADDNTTDSSTTTTAALTAGTAALLRIVSLPTGVLEFWVDDNKIGEFTTMAFGTTTLQPIFGIGKSTGVTTPTCDIDFCYFDANRF